MFRIKTDIRQYKCENKSKVEKLIHNWVVRPSDLIFEDDEWHPIGKHPEFENVFKALATEDEGDTVVTESPFEEEEKKKAEAKKSTDVFDHEDILRDLTTKPEINFTPPVAPEGVEPVHQYDEVTMMTDRTLDILMDYDPSLKEDSDAVDVKTSEEETTKVVESPLKASEEEETTNVKESPLLKQNEEEETTNVKESPLLKQKEEDETTNVKESPLKQKEEETTDIKESPLSNASGKKSAEPNVVISDDINSNEKTDEEPVLEETSAPKLGRHDLPEDFFATNEISKVNREDVQKLDDLNKKEKTADAETEENSVDDAWSDIENEYSEPETSESLAEVSDSFDDTEDSDETDETAAEDSSPESEEVLHINGYEIDFPFPIGPTAEDIKIGLKRTKYDIQRREKTYPHPTEKEYKDPHIRAFEWKREPPKDLSALLIGGAVAFLIILVLLLSQC